MFSSASYSLTFSSSALVWSVRLTFSDGCCRLTCALWLTVMIFDVRVRRLASGEYHQCPLLSFGSFLVSVLGCRRVVLCSCWDVRCLYPSPIWWILVYSSPSTTYPWLFIVVSPWPCEFRLNFHVWHRRNQIIWRFLKVNAKSKIVL